MTSQGGAAGRGEEGSNSVEGCLQGGLSHPRIYSGPLAPNWKVEEPAALMAGLY